MSFNFLENAYNAQINNNNNNDLVIFNKILKSFFDIYLKLSNIMNDDPNNISVEKWNNLKIRKKYLEIFSNIINKNYYTISNYNETNLNTYISNTLRNEIKFTYYKKLNYSNQYSFNIKNIKVSYIDAHGSYMTDMVKLPDNIIVCHITPVNRFSALSTLNRKKIFDSIFNKIDIIEMFNKGISCYQKNIINDNLFQYTQVFYNLCPNISISLEENKSSPLYNKTAVYFNKNGNKYDLFLNTYNESTSGVVPTIKKKSTLKDIVELISKKYPNKKNIIFFNTCRNIDFSYKNSKYFNPSNNNFLNNIYIYEKVLSILNYAIDKCYENKFIKIKTSFINNSTIYSKYSNDLYNVNSVYGKSFSKYHKNKMLKYLKYKDKFLSPSINYFWITILLFYFNEDGIVHTDFNINDEFIDNKRLIQIAISQNNYYITKILLNNNANINDITYTQKFNKILQRTCYDTILNIAMSFNNIDIIKLLIKNNYEITSKDLINLFIDTCISTNNLPLLKNLITNGYKNNSRSNLPPSIKQISNDNKSNILSFAKKSNKKNIINLLENKNNFIANTYKAIHNINNNNNIYRIIKKIGSFNYVKSKIYYMHFKKISNILYGFNFFNDNIISFLVYFIDTKKHFEFFHEFEDSYYSLDINNIFIKNGFIYLYMFDISFNLNLYKLNNDEELLEDLCYLSLQKKMRSKNMVYIKKLYSKIIYPYIFLYDNIKQFFLINLEEDLTYFDIHSVYYIENTNDLKIININLTIDNNLIIYLSTKNKKEKATKLKLKLINLNNKEEIIISHQKLLDITLINNKFIVYYDTHDFMIYDIVNNKTYYYSINKGEEIKNIIEFNKNKFLIKSYLPKKYAHYLYILQIYKGKIILLNKIDFPELYDYSIHILNSDSFIVEKKKEIILYKILDQNNSNREKNNNISKITDIDLDNYRYIYGEKLLKKEDFRKIYYNLFKKKWDIALNYSKNVLKKKNNISNFNNLNIYYTNNKILSKNVNINILTFDNLILINTATHFNLYESK